MKKITKFIIASMLFTICACSSEKPISNNIVKDGQEYVMDNVSFYYPKQYEVISEGNNFATLGFGDAKISYEKSLKLDGNQENELVQLYRLDLENEGYNILSNTTITLDNGDNCQEIVYGDEKIKAKTLFIVEDQEIVKLSYETSKEEYDSSISSINYYLYSLTVKEVQELAIEANG